MVIKAVIFDVGGVLIRTRERGFRHAWDDNLALERGSVEELVFNSPSGVRAQRGELADEEHWLWCAEHLGLSPDALAAFRQDFWRGDFLDDDLVAYIERLRPKYQTAIISNAMTDMRPLLEEHHGIAEAFDLIVISAEAGIMKPEPAIFQLALERLGRRPEEAVFIDDFAQNVEGARDLGMQAIHFQPGLDLPAVLRELGVEPEVMKEDK